MFFKLILFFNLFSVLKINARKDIQENRTQSGQSSRSTNSPWCGSVYLEKMGLKKLGTDKFPRRQHSQCSAVWARSISEWRPADIDRLALEIRMLGIG